MDCPFKDHQIVRLRNTLHRRREETTDTEEAVTVAATAGLETLAERVVRGGISVAGQQEARRGTIS